MKEYNQIKIWHSPFRNGTNWTADFTALAWHITHDCNKMCPFCQIRIEESDYQGITWADYYTVLANIGDPSSIRLWELAGGEPILHPFFHDLVRSLRHDYPNAEIRVLSNAHRKTFLDLTSEIWDLCTWRVTHYPGWNDWILEWGQEKDNIELIRLPDGELYNPFVDPDYSEAFARNIRDGCWFLATLKGSNLYSCHLAEVQERIHGLESLHVRFDRNWKEKWLGLVNITWKACAHCYEAERRVRMGG